MSIYYYFSYNFLYFSISEEDEDIGLTEEELTEEHLTEEQLTETFQDGNLTIADAQVIESVVSEGQVIEQVKLTSDIIGSHGNIDVTFDGQVTETEVIESVADDVIEETPTEVADEHGDVHTIMEVTTQDDQTVLTEPEDAQLSIEMTE